MKTSKTIKISRPRNEFALDAKMRAAPIFSHRCSEKSGSNKSDFMDGWESNEMNKQDILFSKIIKEICLLEEEYEFFLKILKSYEIYEKNIPQICELSILINDDVQYDIFEDFFDLISSYSNSEIIDKFSSLMDAMGKWKLEKNK